MSTSKPDLVMLSKSCAMRVRRSARLGDKGSWRAAGTLRSLMHTVDYALLGCAACLRLGTIDRASCLVKRLDERLGKQHPAPAQCDLVELATGLISANDGLTGLQVRAIRRRNLFRQLYRLRVSG